MFLNFELQNTDSWKKFWYGVIILIKIAFLCAISQKIIELNLLIRVYPTGSKTKMCLNNLGNTSCEAAIDVAGDLNSLVVQNDAFQYDTA